MNKQDKAIPNNVSGTRKTHLLHFYKQIHSQHETKVMRKKRWLMKNLLINNILLNRVHVTALKHSNNTKYISCLTLDIDSEPSLNIGPLLLCINGLRKLCVNLSTSNTSLPGLKYLFRRRIESVSFGITKPDIDLGFLRLKSLELKTDSYFSGQFDLMMKNYKNLQSLTSLRVIIGSFSGPEKDFMALCSLISRIKSLEHIEVCLGMPQEESDYKLKAMSLPYLFKMIRHHPKIRKLSLQIPENGGESILTNDFSIGFLSEYLQPPLTSALQRLDLDLQIYQNLTDKQFGMISNCIRSLNNLESLYLIFSESCSISEKVFLGFTHAIGSLRKLSDISLDLPKISLNPKSLSQIITDLMESKSKTWINIFSYLTLVSHSNRSELVFLGKENFDDSLLGVLSQRINIFGGQNRQNIILNFEKSINLTITGISFLTKNLLSFQNLTQMPIMLPHIPAATNPGTFGILAENNKRITVSIIINKTKKLLITGDDQTITEFIVGLSSSSLGDKLNIDRADIDFSKMSTLWRDTLLSAASFFKSLPNVKGSTIKFTSIKPEPIAKYKVASALAQILQSGAKILLNDDLIKSNNFKNTKEIELKFQTNDIMPYVSFEILRNAKTLPHVEKLNLDFESCSDFGTSEDFEALRLFMSEFKDLSFLSVNLSQCNLNAAIEQFISFLGELGKLKCLKTLILDFSGCEDIDEKSFSPLSESITSMGELTCLDLTFQKCPRIIDSCIGILGQGIRALEQLITLNLNFEECSRISDEQCNFFIVGLRILESLEKMSLRFPEFTLQEDSRNGVLEQITKTEMKLGN